MYVCMYVCTYVRTYVCMYVCMYVSMLYALGTRKGRTLETILDGLRFICRASKQLELRNIRA